MRRIAHLDMDAFYASVELLTYPELKGLPVVIGGRSIPRPSPVGDALGRFARLRDYQGRGVVTTSTYAARALGVFSGMGLMKAAQLAPEAILLPVNFDAYRHYSRLFKAAVRAIAPRIEDRGIDEIYLDLSEIPGDSAEIATRLKAAVRESTGLSCSVGIAPNKLLAKIASDLEKPDGITVLTAADLRSRIWPLPARKINGIGPKADDKLQALGIRSVGELAAADPLVLHRHFGPSYAEWLLQAAHGIDERALVTESSPKSISRETTFERDLHPLTDRALLSSLFTKLCEQVAADLTRKGCVGRTIGVKLRFTDFSSVTRDHTLDQPTADPQLIRRVAGACLKRVVFDRKLRLLGVRVGSLSPAADATWRHESGQGELPLD